MATFVEIKPAAGLSFNNRAPDSHWGKPATIEALYRAGRIWAERYPASTISIGQISRKSGGVMPPHKSHRLGVDVDIRPLRDDLQNLPVTYKDEMYNRDLTREMVKLLREVGKVKLILFNDPVLIAENRCQFYAGHHNHLHVRFLY